MKIKVLIVDDEEIVVKGLSKGLRYNGFDVKTVIGGKEAIQMVEKEFFDVVIVDLVMPGMNGVDTCKGIKKISPKTEVLLLSGFPKEIENLQMKFLEAGGKDVHMRKPLMANEVKDEILKLFKKD